jgi:hypothetical protein
MTRTIVPSFPQPADPTTVGLGRKDTIRRPGSAHGHEDAFRTLTGSASRRSPPEAVDAVDDAVELVAAVGVGGTHAPGRMAMLRFDRLHVSMSTTRWDSYNAGPASLSRKN